MARVHLFDSFKGQTWFGIEVPAREVFLIPFTDTGIGNHPCIVPAEAQRGDDDLDIGDFRSQAFTETLIGCDPTRNDQRLGRIVLHRLLGLGHKNVYDASLKRRR